MEGQEPPGLRRTGLEQPQSAGINNIRDARSVAERSAVQVVVTVLVLWVRKQRPEAMVYGRSC